MTLSFSLRYSSLISALLALAACGGPAQSPATEAQPMGQKQRWYWVGSTSYLNHVSPAKPENYWLEIDGEKAQLKADCNNASAKASTTHEGRLWITGIATTRIACPPGGQENIYLKQLTQTAATEQRGDVLRITLSQYGDAMFFARDPAARFSSYRCEGGESMALIAQTRTLHVWLGDQYSQVTADGKSAVSVQEKGALVDLEQSGESLASNCRKIIPAR